MTAEGHKRVLLVEDEELVRRLMVRILTRWGFDVQEHATAESALAYVRSAPAGGVADVVITDVSTPGITGPELVGSVMDAWPGVRVLYVSGGADRDWAAQGVEDSNAILRKPFTSQELVQEVGNLFQARSGGTLDAVQAMDGG